MKILAILHLGQLPGFKMMHCDCIRFLRTAVLPCALLPFASIFFPIAGRAQTPVIRNRADIEMKIDPADKDPALLVTVPDGSPDDRSFKILLPQQLKGLSCAVESVERG